MNEFEEPQVVGDYAEYTDEELIEELRATEELLKFTREPGWEGPFQGWLALQVGDAVSVLKNESAPNDEIRAAQGKVNAYEGVLLLPQMLEPKMKELTGELVLRKKDEAEQ